MRAFRSADDEGVTITFMTRTPPCPARIMQFINRGNTRMPAKAGMDLVLSGSMGNSAVARASRNKGSETRATLPCSNACLSPRPSRQERWQLQRYLRLTAGPLPADVTQRTWRPRSALTHWTGKSG